MGAYSTQLSGITLRLAAARGRARLNLGFAVLAASLGAAATGFLIAYTVPRVWPNTPLPTTLAFGVFTALVVGALTAIFGWLMIILRSPGLPALARAADVHFGVKERFSTALEVSSRPDGPTSPLIEALIRDAVRHVELLDARILVKWKTPRLAWSLPVLALMIAAAIFLLPAPEGSIQTADLAVTFEAAPLSAAELEQLSVDIVRVAEIIEEQAEVHQDPFLAAVAQTLRSLGEDVVSDTPPSRGEIMSQLAALSDYASEATKTMIGNAQRIPDLLDALAETVETPPGEGGASRDQFGAAANAAAVPPEQMGATGYEEEAYLTIDLTRRGRSVSATVDDIIRTFETPLETVGGLRPDAPSGPVPLAPPTEPATADDEAAAPLVADLLGSSDQANAGFSLLAGQGTQPLAGDDLMEVRLEFETDAQLVLDGMDNGAGQRVSMDVAPPTRFTEPANASGELPTVGWRAVPSAGIIHPFIAVFDSRVVRNYFQPDAKIDTPVVPQRPAPVTMVE